MKHVLVIGGGGFVGSAIVKRLHNTGCTISVAGRNHYHHIAQRGCTCLRGDIGEQEFTNAICRNIDTVFHVAAKAGIWGTWAEYERINLTGTKNVVRACQQNGVKQLVYTSTPSVVFSQKDIINGNETLPYADNFLCNYAKSKALAEQLVLANNSSTLKTCAIRPHLVWGPHDPHLIPRIIDSARAGTLQIVGQGNNLVDIAFVDNVAHAHILAARTLEQTGKCAGKAYFIGQENPVSLWQWINELLEALAIKPTAKKISFARAYLVGGLLEMMYLGLKRESEPPMTRFLAYQLSHSHYFSHHQALTDFGYQPVVSLEEGKKQLLTWLTEQSL